MKVFSAIAALAFVVSTVSAAIRPEVQACIDAINTVDAQLKVVAAGVSAWTVASGYLGALAVQAKEQQLEADIQDAIDACCAVEPPITDEEAEAVLAAVDPLVDDVVATLNVIIARHADFDSVPLVTNLVKTDLVNLRALTDELDQCLLDRTPADYLTQAQAYIADINGAFDDAYAEYGLP